MKTTYKETLFFLYYQGFIALYLFFLELSAGDPEFKSVDSIIEIEWLERQ